MTHDEPASANEAARLAALERYAIIDTPAEEEFNHLVELAALAFRVPWAAITFVDGFRAWRKAAFPADQRREAPRNVSFCGQTIESTDVLVVPDATADPCFADFPNVTGGTKVRFYAGAPLVTADGHRIGTICLLDNAPREFDSAQIELLRGFAREAMHKIEVRLKLARTNGLSRQLGKIIKSFPIGVVTCDIEGKVTSCSPVAERITGWTEAEVVGKRFPFVPRGREDDFKKLLRALKRGETVAIERCRLRRKDGSHTLVRVSSAPLFAADGNVIGFVSAGEDINAVELAKQRERVLEAAVLSAFSRAVIVTAVRPDGDPRIAYVNPTFSALYGFDAVEVLGRSERMLAFEGEDPASVAAIAEARKNHTPVIVETLHRRKNGEVFWCELGLTPVIDSNGRCSHWVAFAHDVTSRRRAEQLQRDRIAIVEMMAANAPIELILHSLATAGERTRPETRVRICVAGLGFAAIDCTLTAMPRDRDAGSETVWSSPIRAGNSIGGTLSFHAPSHVKPTLEDHRMCEELADLAGIAIERVRDRERLEFLALNDALTGLPNRASFEDALGEALASADSTETKVAVGKIDIDCFKAINDSLGYAMGNRLLVEIGARLGLLVRSGEALARFGGDEFAILFSGLASREEALERAAAIQSAFIPPFDLSGLKLRVDASIGLCVYPDDAREKDEMLTHCDATLADQKVTKRRVVFLDPPKAMRQARYE